jgi:hypothetical protein
MPDKHEQKAIKARAANKPACLCFQIQTSRTRAMKMLTPTTADTSHQATK